jgi:hypothetical protein
VSRLGRLGVSLGIIGALACSDVTEPRNPEVEAAAAVANVGSPIEAGEIEDALDRVLPAMADEERIKGLETALRALLEVVGRGDLAAASGAVEAAERALDAFARGLGPAGGDAADVDVIGLAIASVRDRVAK